MPEKKIFLPLYRMSVPLTVSTGVPGAEVLLAEEFPVAEDVFVEPDEFVVEPEEPGLLELAEPSVAEDSMFSSPGPVVPLEESSPQAVKNNEKETAIHPRVLAMTCFLKFM